MSIIDSLVTDRAREDINRCIMLREKIIARTATKEEIAEWLGELKGVYNASDLNRVESAVAYLIERFNLLPGDISEHMRVTGVAQDKFFEVPYKYPISVEIIKTDWNRSEIPTRNDLIRYLSNVTAVKDVLHVEGEISTDGSISSYADANEIERILKNVYDAITDLWLMKKQYIDNTSTAWFYSGDLYGGEI